MPALRLGMAPGPATRRFMAARCTLDDNLGWATSTGSRFNGKSDCKQSTEEGDEHDKDVWLTDSRDDGDRPPHVR